AFTRAEFAGTIALDIPAADSANDPLPHIPGEMHEQVADAVRLIVRAPPQRVRRQGLHRRAELRAVLGAEVVARAIDECLGQVHRGAPGGRISPQIYDAAARLRIRCATAAAGTVRGM